MSISRFVCLPALALIGSLGLAFADDAPVDLHPPASAKPAKTRPTKGPAATAAPAGEISAAEAVSRANGYLNGMQSMIADFVLVGPDGHRAEGKLSLQRPGRMRFQYAPPDRLEIVADGRSVAVRDQKLNTQDLYFIGQTPLKFLLADHVDLARDTQVKQVTSDANAVSIQIFDKATFGGSANITLLFDPQSFALKQWTVLDAQGYETVTKLFNVDLTTPPDPSLFKIDEQRMR